MVWDKKFIVKKKDSILYIKKETIQKLYTIDLRRLHASDWLRA